MSNETSAQSIRIEAVPEEQYEGRQWGYRIIVNDEPLLHATAGSTGPCWNLARIEQEMGEEVELESWHLCDLNDLIEALTALRDSEANRLNVERWS